MDILLMEIKLAINMWKQIPEIANQFEDLEYFFQQGGKKSLGTGVFLVLWFPGGKWIKDRTSEGETKSITVVGWCCISFVYLCIQN